jgi:hypothetical protein
MLCHFLCSAVSLEEVKIDEDWVCKPDTSLLFSEEEIAVDEVSITARLLPSLTSLAFSSEVRKESG